MKQAHNITYDQFRNATYALPEGSRFVGAWETKEILYFVYEYRNGAKLRVTFWRAAGMVLACAKDKNGCYHCLNSNIKTMEELTEIIEKFDYRRFDAKEEKRVTRPSMPAAGDENFKRDSVAAEEIKGILERLNSI